MPLILRNPHSALAVLEQRPGDAIRLTAPARASNDSWDRVVQVAREKKVSVGTAAKSSPSKSPHPSAQSESQRLGIAELSIKEKASVSIEELFKTIHPQGLWLALDSLQDPHNVGAIFRAAAFFGVKGIIMTQERSAPMTATVYDVASGGVEYVPFAMQVNLQRAFEVAKKAGLWILGSSEHAHDRIQSIPRDRPWLLVLGNEEKGMRRLTEESCDMLCKVAGDGRVGSLNVAVAAGILVSHLVG